MERSVEADEPFFVWLTSSRMHLYTRIDDEWLQKVEKYTFESDYYGAGMLQHDHDTRVVLKALKDMGVDENTNIVYSTDNGPEHSSWRTVVPPPFAARR